MRLIVGLGNPGPEYAHTPHNLGFAVVERLAGQARIRTREQPLRARLWRGWLEDTEVILAQPRTFMNLSGRAVAELLGAEGLSPAELIVISDDAALPWGQLRIRERGSAGGHNGLESVIAELGTAEFLRVRLGIQPRSFGAGGGVGDLAPPSAGLADYVLRPMDADDRRQADEMIAEAVEAVRIILREGAKPAMTRFNRRTAAEAGPPGP